MNQFIKKKIKTIAKNTDYKTNWKMEVAYQDSVKEAFSSHCKSFRIFKSINAWKYSQMQNIC